MSRLVVGVLALLALMALVGWAAQETRQTFGRVSVALTRSVDGDL